MDLFVKSMTLFNSLGLVIFHFSVLQGKKTYFCGEFCFELDVGHNVLLSLTTSCHLRPDFSGFGKVVKLR